jgi:glycosyltransferase involved in cell wall biosynthesis
MNVMQVIYSFGTGGSESVAKDIAINMKNHTTHSVTALESDGPLKQILNDAGIQTFVINKRPGEKFSPMLRLWKAMKEFEPDVVHTHHLYELFFAWPGALLSGARIIHTEHEYYSLMAPKVRFRLHLLSKICNAVTGVNEETSEFLSKNVGIRNKVFTVVNGIDLTRYRSISRNRNAVGLKEDDKVIGIVARLTPVKDHVTLLKAFRIVTELIPEAKLLIVGDGVARPHLESLTKYLALDSSVIFLGNRHDIPELLSCMDVVALSSKEEGLPLSILEALAASKPVVATKVGGIPRVVTPGETGLLVPPEDALSMANAIVSLLTNKDQAKQMGKNGRKLIEKKYDLKNSIDKYYSLYLSN